MAVAGKWPGTVEQLQLQRPDNEPVQVISSGLTKPSGRLEPVRRLLVSFAPAASRFQWLPILAHRPGVAMFAALALSLAHRDWS